MSDKNKTAPVRQHQSGKTKNTPDKEKGCILPNDNNTVYGFLQHGAENAISTQELMRLVGCSDVRTLRALVAAERNAGAVILSKGSGGYFLPDSGEKGKQEIEECITLLRSRAVGILKALKAARRELRNVSGQIGGF